MPALLFAVCAALVASAPAAAPVARSMPAGLVASLHEPAGALTSIVVVDIDADGDPDVVATDGALNLFVWINDGTGRLTRQQPAPAGRGGSATEPRGVERRSPGSEPPAPTDPPAFDACATSTAAGRALCGAVDRRTCDDRGDRPRTTLQLRGPPAGSLPL